MIKYGNIEITGVPFSKLTELNIRQSAGEHGYAVIAGEMTPKNAEECVSRADETSKIVIKSKKDPQLTLFVGTITHIRAENDAKFSRVIVEAATVSYLLDIKQKSRSFQNTKKKYSEIIKEALKEEKAELDFNAADTVINKPVLQLDETDWEFAVRMAAELGAMVFAPIAAEKPRLIVGRPKEVQSAAVTLAEYFVEVDNAAYQKALKNLPKGKKAPIQQDFLRLDAQSPNYLYLADKLTVNKKAYYVKSMQAELFREGLIMKYELVGATAFLPEKLRTPELAGRMLTAQVKDVKEDKVKVHLLELDGQYDKDTQWWFPYSTVYSSSDGSGWYVMPEKNDYVRILFPSDDTAMAFAASAVNTAPGKKPEDKRFKAPKGKELLFTEQGIYIICDHKKIFIDLTDSNGVRIVSASDINIVSKANITLQAGSDVQILAKKQVMLGTPGSAITITPSKITMAAKSITLT